MEYKKEDPISHSLEFSNVEDDDEEGDEEEEHIRALKTKLVFTKENKITNHWFIGVIHIEFANWVGTLT
jgi:hypothetical protein